jgi:hypothetical protein
MDDIEIRLVRMEARQEALIAAIGKLADVVATTHDSVVELLAWAQQPPSSDMPDLLGKLVAAVETLDGRLARLPEQVAALVRGHP